MIGKNDPYKIENRSCELFLRSLWLSNVINLYGIDIGFGIREKVKRLALSTLCTMFDLLCREKEKKPAIERQHREKIEGTSRCFFYFLVGCASDRTIIVNWLAIDDLMKPYLCVDRLCWNLKLVLTVFYVIDIFISITTFLINVVMETLEYFIDASFDDFDLNSINVSFTKTKKERSKEK